MKIMKALLRIIVGVLFGVGSAVMLVPAFAALDQGDIAASAWYLIVLLCIAICFFVPTIRRAFGRGFLMLGASVFALPLSTFLLSSRVGYEVVNESETGSEGLAILGAGIAGFAMTGLATFFGLILGAILLLVGLILSLGGRREVIVVETKEDKKEPSLKK